MDLKKINDDVNASILKTHSDNFTKYLQEFGNNFIQGNKDVWVLFKELTLIEEEIKTLVLYKIELEEKLKEYPNNEWGDLRGMNSS